MENGRSHQPQNTERIIDEVQDWQFGYPWVANKIEEGNEKDGEMNYNSTGAMWTGK